MLKIKKADLLQRVSINFANLSLQALIDCFMFGRLQQS